MPQAPVQHKPKAPNAFTNLGLVPQLQPEPKLQSSSQLGSLPRAWLQHLRHLPTAAAAMPPCREKLPENGSRRASSSWRVHVLSFFSSTTRAAAAAGAPPAVGAAAETGAPPPPEPTLAMRRTCKRGCNAGYRTSVMNGLRIVGLGNVYTGRNDVD